MDLVADLDALFADFGIDAVVDGVTVRALFDNGSVDAFGIVAGTAPILLTASAGISSAAVGDAVTANSVAYTITDIQPDGTGMSRLLLDLAA